MISKALKGLLFSRGLGDIQNGFILGVYTGGLYWGFILGVL
jgi:hypothetical protein